MLSAADRLAGRGNVMLGQARTLQQKERYRERRHAWVAAQVTFEQVNYLDFTTRWPPGLRQGPHHLISNPPTDTGQQLLLAQQSIPCAQSNACTAAALPGVAACVIDVGVHNVHAIRCFCQP
jgi:hypothetical protein